MVEVPKLSPAGLSFDLRDLFLAQVWARCDEPRWAPTAGSKLLWQSRGGSRHPNATDAAQIKQLRAELGPAAIAKRLGIGRSSVYRALRLLRRHRRRLHEAPARFKARSTRPTARRPPG
jgi:hypothetical protein